MVVAVTIMIIAMIMMVRRLLLGLGAFVLDDVPQGRDLAADRLPLDSPLMFDRNASAGHRDLDASHSGHPRNGVLDLRGAGRAVHPADPNSHLLGCFGHAWLSTAAPSTSSGLGAGAESFRNKT